MKNQRDYSWDFMRALFLLLGIPFHAAVVYSTHFDWTVPSPDRSLALTILADLIHVFRMPGFFVIAGYFSIMILLRDGAREWLVKRLVRLGVPLVMASLTILPAQILIQTRAEVLAGVLDQAEYWQMVMFRLSHFDEPWVSHLWFLYSLIAFSAGLALTVMVLGTRRFRQLAAQAIDLLCERKWLAFIGVSLFCALLAVVMPEIYGRFGTKLRAVSGYLQYFPFFMLGVAVHLGSRIKERYVGLGFGALGVGLVLAIVSMVRADSVWSSTVFMLSGLVGAVLITGFIARFARRHFAKPNAAIARVVDASFSIYLFHHPIILVLAMVFAQVNWPPVAEFAVMVPVATGLAYLVHQLIAANPVTAFLFNGVLTKPAVGAERLKAAILRPLAQRS